MTDTTPSASEIAGPCREVFDGLAPHAVVERFRNALGVLDPRVLEMPDDLADRWFESSDGVGLWSCRALLTHLMDADVLYFMRVRRVLAEENPVFENWDEDAFLNSRLCTPGENALLMPIGATVATIHTLRQTAATVLVQLEEIDWNRKAMNPYLGEVTLLDMLRYVCWHFEHHAAILNAKVIKLLGEPETGGGEWAGCGEGCSCAAPPAE